jgi:hypothetical protein
MTVWMRKETVQQTNAGFAVVADGDAAADAATAQQ